jgi:[acyl-carrier-protein] S-malonyltransferase
MLPWLDSSPEATPPLALIAEKLGADWRARLSDPDWSQRNAVAQPLLTGLSIAAWQVLQSKLPKPAVVAGYSVGELAAFCVAGVFGAVDAMALAAERAAAMDRSAAGQDTGLLYVQGPDSTAMAAACMLFGVSLAIRMGTDRVVVGGTTQALQAAQQALTSSGAHCTTLPVRVASHTPWMAQAADDFEARLERVALSPPRSILVCNHTGGAEREPGRLSKALARQIANPVLWDSCMDAMAERRVRCVLEVGAGHALANLWRDRHPDIPVRAVDDFRGVPAIARWIDTALQ